MSTGFNDRPHQASRPYDRDRDGFVMGEGAGCVVLEEYEHAKARGARIYAELIGYGLSGDAYHITAPSPDGDGAFRSMSAALKRAGVSVSEIDYVNAHGTSTPVGDEIELRAVERLLGNAAGRTTMSSTKSSIGHLLGAAGAVEAIFSILAIRDQIAPPTLNLDNPSVETAIDLAPHEARKRPIRGRAVEFVRLRRHQRVDHFPRRGVSRSALANRHFVTISGHVELRSRVGRKARQAWDAPEALRQRDERESGTRHEPTTQ